MSKPWLKFYPGDWQSEVTLKRVSRAARSLWLDILCLIHQGGDGRLQFNGDNPTERDLSAVLGDDPRTIRKLLAELESAGVFSRDGQNFITSRRILRDNIKAEQDKNNGKLGGNPSLKNNDLGENGVNPEVKAQKLEARSYILESKNTDPSDLPSCPNPAPKRARSSYPDDFEIFWKAYPTDPNMSKKEAHAAWKRMAPEDRQRATAAVPAFREYCAGKPDYRPVHACRFLTQQRYEGFAQTPSSNNQTSAPPEAWMPSDEELRARYARTTHEQAVSASGSDAGATATNVSRQGHEVHRDHEGVGQRPLRLDRDGPARVGELGSLLVGALRKASGPDARGEIWNEEGFHLPNEMAGMVRQ